MQAASGRFPPAKTGNERTTTMGKNDQRILGILWLGFGALLVGMILAAPVMQQPANGTISATNYFDGGR
jgi:hypothetical protein